MYRSVEWHTNSDGYVKEIAVEYDRTFWQWVFRKPATEKRWKMRDGEWWAVLPTTNHIRTTEKIVIEGNTALISIGDPKEVKEIVKVMDYIWRQNYLKDLEDRCRKILPNG